MLRYGQLTSSGLRRVLTVLCVTEIVSWGVLFYAFTVLAPGSVRRGVVGEHGHRGVLGESDHLGADRDRGRAGAGPDRARVVMTTGSVLAVPALVVIAEATTLPVFFAGLVLAGSRCRARCTARRSRR